MARPLMFVARPWMPFEITIRCMQSRLLMRPGDECSRRVVGVLARALELYGDRVHLYFAGGTSNHLHIVAAFESAEVKAQFKCHIKTNISKELGALFDWPGAHWDRRTRDIPILDDEALVDRLAYLAAHGVKEGLVESPGCWPGIQWVRAVAEGKPLVGVWYARSRLCVLRRRWGLQGDKGPKPTLGDVAVRKVLRLTPPPMWAGLSESALQAKWVELVALAVERHPAPWPTRVVGAAALVEMDPHTRPPRTKKTPAPKVHTRCKALRQAWCEAYAMFVERYRAALQALREGWEAVRFPVEGCRPAVLLPEAGG